ncbi:hypothetical protein B0H12DRAFT_1073003 [Mycena haematopus]|nr:hypothetical protein B0H12DRAFT_1073003 [Mycena haematopus]
MALSPKYDVLTYLLQHRRIYFSWVVFAGAYLLIVPSPDMRLPQELADVIVDFVDELEDLRSCALRIGRPGEKPDITQLCELLEGSPSFAARVKSIRLWDLEGYKDPGQRCWIAKADLSRLLSLVSLTRLCIAASLHWPTVSVVNRHSIQVILPALTSLDLRGVAGLPLTVLSHCSSALRSLLIESVYFANDSNSTPPAYMGSAIQLEHLTLGLILDFLDSFVHWILSPESPFDISCLRSLECSVYDPDDHIPIQLLLDASASSLQHLCLSHTETFSETASLDLRALVHLHTLSLVMWPTSPRLPLSNLVFPQQQALALLLTIHIIHTDDQHSEFVRHLADANRTLAALPFKTVTITFFLWSRDDQWEKKVIDVSDEFTPVMPMLASRLGGAGALRILKSLPVPLRFEEVAPIRSG